MVVRDEMVSVEEVPGSSDEEVTAVLLSQVVVSDVLTDSVEVLPYVRLVSMAVVFVVVDSDVLLSTIVDAVVRDSVEVVP